MTRCSLTVAAGGLKSGNAVAALIELDDGRYVMQHRDDVPDIWYPGHWGCFGGSLESGEDLEIALRRELYEEIEFVPRELTYFTRIDFDMSSIGMGKCFRAYYAIPMNSDEYRRLVLHEGQAISALTAASLLDELRMTPYDAFALFLFHNRRNLVAAHERE